MERKRELISAILLVLQKTIMLSLAAVLALLLLSGQVSSQVEGPLLSDQVRDGLVEVVGEGIGATFSQPLLRLKVRLLAGPLASGTILPGQILRSDDASACDVVALGLTGPVEVSTEQPEAVSSLLGYCIQIAPGQRSFPNERIRYALTGEMASGATLSVLGQIASDDRFSADRIGVQMAVWAAENGVRDRDALQALLPQYAGLIPQHWPEINSLLSGTPFVVSTPVQTGPLPTVMASSTTVALPEATVRPQSTSDGNPSSLLPIMAVALVGTFVVGLVFMVFRSIRTPTVVRPVNNVIDDLPPPEVERTNPWRQGEQLQSSRSNTSRVTPKLKQRVASRAKRRTGTELVPETESRGTQEAYRPVHPRDAVRVGQYSDNRIEESYTPQRQDSSSQSSRTILMMEPGLSQDQKTQIELRPLDDMDRDVMISIHASGGLISRGAVSYIDVEDDTVSDPHAMLIVDGNQVFIRDLHSSTGTKVGEDPLLPTRELKQPNGRTVIAPNERELRHRDRIVVGKAVLEYRGERKEIAFPQMARQPISLRSSDRWLIGRRKLPFAVEENSRRPYEIFDNETVSMPHAKLELLRLLYIQDLNSANGTYVNNRRLPPGERFAIYDGAVIRIGALGFEVIIAEDGFQKGSTINKYQLLRHIASGNMANIWKARNVDFDSERALKIPRLGHFLRQDQTGTEFRRAFEREMDISRTLLEKGENLTNLVRIYDTGEYADESDDGMQNIPYVAMELVAGFDVAQYLLEKRSIPEPEAIEISRRTALGVMQLHQLGWMHGDIKPENLIVREGDSDVLLVDFGAARLLEDQNGGAIFTSRQYVPEDYLENRMPSPSVDLYMIAATLYEMITGEPWRESEPNDLSILADGDSPAQRPAAITRRLSVLKSPEERLGLIQNIEVRNILQQALQPRNRTMSLMDFVSGVEPHCQGADLTQLVSQAFIPA